MRSRSLFWILLGLLVLAGAWFFWPAGHRASVPGKSVALHQAVSVPTLATTRSASTAPQLFGAGNGSTNSQVKTNAFAWRLSNTPRTIGQLVNDPHAILLENALIDTQLPLNFSIPKNLQAPGDPGAYIVQARGPVDGAFRAALAAAGAQIVSYIPNNAYLVTLSSGGAAGLSGQPAVQNVIPYEPYYKLPASLLSWVGKTYPADQPLRVAAYPNTADALQIWLANSGAQILAQDTSPFGKTFIIQNVTDVAALVQQNLVQRAEPVFRRAVANDLARVTLGISADTVTSTNYLNLSGSNVLVEVNDSGIDQTHPDFSLNENAEASGAAAIPPGSGRVTGDQALSLVDTNGHGTHVAGIIAGNGWASYTVTNTPQGSVTNADFRGKAPAADLFSVAFLDVNGNSFDVPDAYLQSEPALTNALISNNSWTYVGDNSYDLAAASYDAAVRDALPLATGSQPVLFVFAAGNDGGGDDSGGGGSPDTILSPGTAKDVITVGALEQERNLTNTYTPLGSTNPVVAWATATDNSAEVAGYSARGNVGIGSEGTYGRFKPDVVAPGSFVVSTRSQQWDTAAYYNPSNFYDNEFDNQVVGAGGLQYYSLPVPGNAVSVKITLQSTGNLSVPTNMPIYVEKANYPNPPTYDFETLNDMVSIPPDSGGAITGIQDILTNGFYYAIGNPTNFDVNYNLLTEIVTTNDNGNYFQVLSNLNDTIGPWYRYETGTSMATPAVSGTLALMQDYFTNTLHSTPSPALLKAMLINGARAVGNYNFVVTNAINFQGWGLANVPNSLPAGLTNRMGAACSSFFLDQSPTNALATGASQSFLVTIPTTSSAQASSLPLRVTLAWTDPPGNPAAAIKLVNNLDLVVSNNVTGDVYFGNDIPYGSIFNATWNTNAAPNLDAINNIENVFLSSSVGGTFTVTVIGNSVNVNAVTAQTNNATGAYAPNVVQDFALVIACGEGEVTNAITVTPGPPVYHPTSDQQITVVGINANGMTTNSVATGGIFLDQFAGASTPLLGTNTVGAGAGYVTNAVVTLGMTNQWHFYVVQNTTTFTNAAFVTFSSQTLATPRMGVFANATQNPTQPEADIDMYVSTDPGLTNLDPNVISTCVHGTQVGASVAATFSGASLGNGTGTEFVADTNSQPNQLYYIGVKSETADAAEYGFLPVFSQQPFSLVQNGNEIVNGLLLPVNIPDGSPAHPGIAYIFALAVQPIPVENVIITNQIVHQNFGDLVGTFQHNGTSVILNNHDSLFNALGVYNLIYDQSPAPITGSQPPDGPGNLTSFQGQQGLGPWILTEVDNSLTQTGTVTGLTLLITPHQDLGNGINVTLPPNSYFYGFIDVAVGVTNLTISATNTTMPLPDTTAPGQLFEKLGQQPVPPPASPTNFDKMVFLTNYPASPPAPPNIDPGNSISVGPSDVPPIQPGRYYVTLYNPSTLPQNFFIIATLGVGQVAPVDFGSAGPVPLLDDAVTYSYITNNPVAPATNEIIAAINVGIRVDHPRISDLVFHLISPDGTRYLLMENRGGTSTNGAGVTIFTTNTVTTTASGNNASNTNVVDVGETQGTFPISYNFFTVPDQMTVYYGTNLVPANLIYNSGYASGSSNITVSFPPLSPTEISSNLTIVMNQFGNTNSGGDLWTYQAGGISTNYYYLTFTDDTNLTTTPIKFAPPPFVPNVAVGNVFTDSFETYPLGSYSPASTFGVWTVASSPVTITNNPAAADGANFVALQNGVISTTLPTTAGQSYTLSFDYREGPTLQGLVSWWPGESNAVDIISGNNGALSGGGTYGVGEVGSAFVLTNTTGYIQVPASSSLNVGVSNGYTFEAWINPVSLLNPQAVAEWNNNAGGIGAHLWISASGGGSGPVGCLYANLVDTTGINHIISSAGGLVKASTYQHVAVTYNKTTGVCVLYLNGVAIQTQNLGVFTPQTGYDFYMGARPSGFLTGYNFDGAIDEPALFNRALSASEIQAIFIAGHEGKCGLTTPPAICAEAALSVLNGMSTNTIVGTTNWQTSSVVFTATQTGTPFQVSGLTAGMFVDHFVLSQPPGNLYYQPEQDLTPLIGTSAYGLWTLEIQDDRAGATNQAVLDSWQLSFVFANTNPVPANPTPILLPPGTEICNPVPTNDIFWYQVNVPLNGIFATNRLISSDQPVNLLFNTNSPDTSGSVTLLSDQTNGIFVIGTGTNSVPPLVPGSTYYLGVQNPNNVPVADACIEVDFDLLPTAYAFTEPAQLVTGTNAQLNGMATPNGYFSTAWFQWGTNTFYGNSTPPFPVGSGSNVVYTTRPISGLVTNVPYHFRLVVSNAVGVVYGFDQILDEANVVAWGADYLGQANVPTNLNNVVAIAGAYDHSLALKNNGMAIGWGDNNFGQATVPAGLSNLLAVAGGQYYSLVLKSNGTVAAWGANLLNQTNVPPGLSNVVVIAGGTYSSLALRNDGTVAAWGATFFNLTNVPANVTNAVAIAGGSYHSLALKNDGTVLAWGDDSVGQTNVPPGLTNVVAIAGGSYHSLALKYDGTVVSWGDNSAGQTNVPVGLSNVVAVAAGGFHSLALKSDGNVVAWGDDTAGQIIVPLGLSNVVAIAGGYLHSLALTSLTNIFGINATISELPGDSPVTNTIFPHNINYYLVTVPTNADFATNSLLFTLQPGPLNVWFTTNSPPSITNLNDTLLLAGVTNSIKILSASTSPRLVPGSTYYLGVNNTNNFSVTYGIEVDFHLVTTIIPPPFTNVIVISSIVHTNINSTNGFLLTWFAPSNDLFQVQWTGSFSPTNWTTFTNIVSYNPNFPASATNAQFNFFDDGILYPFGLTRFYRLILLTAPPVITITNPVSIASIVHTNILGTSGYWLTWFAPSNDLFKVQWKAGLAAATWNTFSNIVSYNTNFPVGPTNAQFCFFDDATQTSGVFDPTRFYRLILYGSASSANILTLPVPANFTAAASALVTVTNMATDSNPAAILNYSLVNPPAGVGISANGIITWTNATPSGLAARFTTLVTDNGVPSAQASNTFTIFVAPIPSITNVTETATNVVLQWSAPTNDVFEVQWKTNLVSLTWTLFPGTITSPTGIFSFTDTNAPLLMKFYQLILLP